MKTTLLFIISLVQQLNSELIIWKMVDCLQCSMVIKFHDIFDISLDHTRQHYLRSVMKLMAHGKSVWWRKKHLCEKLCQQRRSACMLEMDRWMDAGIYQTLSACMLNKFLIGVSTNGWINNWANILCGFFILPSKFFRRHCFSCMCLWLHFFFCMFDNFSPVRRSIAWHYPCSWII